MREWSIVRSKSFMVLAVVQLLLVSPLHSQHHWTASLTSGYTVPNSSEWRYIADISAGVDVAWSRPCVWLVHSPDTIDPPYHLRQPYELGVRGNFTFFPNAIAGQRIGLLGFISEPLLTFGGGRQLRLEMGAGLAYYTKPYSRSHDEDNVFIGSALNCLIQCGLSYNRPLSDGSALVVAGKFNHSSNGYLVRPNKGLNYLQVELGYRFPHRTLPALPTSEWQLVDSTACRILSTACRQEAYPGHSFFVSYASGVVRTRTIKVPDRLYYAYTGRMGWQYWFTPCRAVGANLDLTYNTTHTGVRNIEHDDYPLPFYVGLCANYETCFHRLSLHLALATYLLKSDQAYTSYYERVGLFYHFGDDVRRIRHFVGVSIKAHGAHADFIEWHYGIRLKTQTHQS